MLGNITSGNQVGLVISGAKNNTATVHIFNTNGQRIQTLSATNGIQYINIGQSAGGMLLLQITDGTNTVTKKVMNL